MDALSVRTGITLLAAASVTLAIATHEELAPVDEVGALFVFTPPSPPTSEELALRIATERFGDARYPFEVFSTEARGSLRAVFVRRSTGDCGGCGALTAAVVFRGGEIVVSQLGEYGRFGHGPDRIELLDVIGHPVIVVDESFTLQGESRTYREYFVVDHEIRWNLCLQIAGTDHDQGIAWRASNWIAAEGTMYFTGHYTAGGEQGPSMRGFSFPFDHGWQGRPEEGRCIEPRSDQQRIPL